MKGRRKTTYEHTTHEYVVDSKTGQVEEEHISTRATVKLSAEPDFVKVYLNHLGAYKGLQVSLTPILRKLLERASYANNTEGGMVIYLNKALKEDIAKTCEVSLTRVDHAVTEFVRSGYMHRVQIGKYQFNPFLFGKGEWRDIQSIRATYDYKEGTVEAEIVMYEEKELNEATEKIAAHHKEISTDELDPSYYQLQAKDVVDNTRA